jgi:transcription initiation factor TFIIF subunit beta
MPKDLIARWSSLQEEDKHLATLRLYDDPMVNGRMFLFLPPHPNNPPSNLDGPQFGPDAHVTVTENDPTIYELEILNKTEVVKNQIVVAERPKDPTFSAPGSSSKTPSNSRARTTIWTGSVNHYVTMRPTFNKTYRQRVKEKNKSYNTPKRQIMRIDGTNMRGGNAELKRLTTGMIGKNAMSDLIVRPLRSDHYFFIHIRHLQRPKTKGKNEGRFTRMARNDLLDLIFQNFRENPRWSIKALRAKTQQPEQWLRQCLQEVAFLHRTGEFNGLWELMDNFKEPGVSVIRPSK